MSKIILTLLPLVLKTVSPELKAMVIRFAHDFGAKAKATDNPWDDVLALLLKSLLTEE